MQVNGNIDNGKPFDWGLASEDYAKYRDIYPDEFYERIAALGLCREGQRVLDLGTGTGVLPRNMAKYGARFVGADISENQILEAERLSEEAGLDIDYIVASAETVDFPDASFDAVTACQCYMYFDKAVVLPKIHALLKPGGHFAILFMAWLPDESEIARRSEELVLKYNPDWTGGHMKRYEPKMPYLAKELFTLEDAAAFDLDVPFTRETWHGRMKACRGIGASSLTEREKARWEKEHLEFLSGVPESFTITHYATILKLRRKDI